MWENMFEMEEEMVELKEERDCQRLHKICTEMRQFLDCPLERT